MIRKAGKLPGSTIKQKYDIEYGNAIMEAQAESIKKNENVLIADDLLATGGTAHGCSKISRRNWRQCGWLCIYSGIILLGRRKIVTRQRISCSLNGDLLI